MRVSWRGWVGLVWAIAAVAALLVSPVGVGHVRGGVPQVGDSESARAAVLIERDMPGLGNGSLVLAFSSPSLRVQVDEPYQRSVEAVAGAVASVEGVGRIMAVPDFPGLDPHHAYLLVGLAGGAESAQESIPAVREAAHAAAAAASRGHVSVAVTGPAPVYDALVHTDLGSLQRAEVLAVPLALVLLVAGLGSLGAALVPLLAAGLAVLVSTGALLAFALVSDVDTLTLAVATSVGFGLGLDYALLFLLRYRHAREQGADPYEASSRARGTAGHAIAWCAGAVVLASAALLVVGVDVFRTMGLAVAVATLVATATATTLLPAVLPCIEPMLEFGRLPRRHRPDHGTKVWLRWAHHLMGRPWRYLLAAGAVLLIAATPLSDLRLGVRIDRTALVYTEAGRGMRQIEADGLANITFLAFPHTAEQGPVDTGALSDRLRADPRISTVATLDNGHDLTVLALTDRVPVDAPAAAELTASIRSAARQFLPAGQKFYATGPAAMVADFRAAMNAALWHVAALVLATSFALMFLAFRSVLIPLKALFMNALSLAASFGLLAWTTRHTADSVHLGIPLVALTIVFGVSMDYEIFLVHRITEHYRAHGDCRRAVADGLAETARPITTAAATLACVFAVLMTTRQQDLQQLGFLVATAVLLDATVVRLVLVPALMRLLDHRNWWLPPALHRLHSPLLPIRAPRSGADPATTPLSGTRKGHSL